MDNTLTKGKPKCPLKKGRAWMKSKITFRVAFKKVMAFLKTLKACFGSHKFSYQ